MATLRVITRPSPVALCKSRNYANSQGRVSPGGLGQRRALPERSAGTTEAYRTYRRLVSPLTSLTAFFDRGDIVEAEFAQSVAR